MRHRIIGGGSCGRMLSAPLGAFITLMSYSVFTPTPFVIVAEACATAPEERILESPKAHYSCRVVARGDPGGGEDVYLRSAKNSGHERLIFTSVRAVSITWSPDDQWFSITDFSDGHMTGLYVFRIGRTSGSASEWDVEQVYASPSMRYDTHWTLESWNVPQGTIRVSCRFCFPGTESAGSHQWHKRTYEIPIDAKPAARGG